MGSAGAGTPPESAVRNTGPPPNWGWGPEPPPPPPPPRTTPPSPTRGDSVCGRGAPAPDANANVRAVPAAPNPPPRPRPTEKPLPPSGRAGSALTPAPRDGAGADWPPYGTPAEVAAGAPPPGPVPAGPCRRSPRSCASRVAFPFPSPSSALPPPVGCGGKGAGNEAPSRPRARSRRSAVQPCPPPALARAPATSRSSSRHRERRSFHPPTACGFLSPQPACVESPASAELEAICVSVFSHDTGVRDARQSSPDGLKKKKTSLLRVERRADHPRAARTENCFCADVRGDAWEARRRGGSRRTACAAAFASEPPTALVKPPSHWGARASPAEFSKSGIFVGRKGGA